jgi:hypothetical protein
VSAQRPKNVQYIGYLAEGKMPFNSHYRVQSRIQLFAGSLSKPIPLWGSKDRGSPNPFLALDITPPVTG